MEHLKNLSFGVSFVLASPSVISVVFNFFCSTLGNLICKMGLIKGLTSQDS